jgi:hypothetical protein
MQGLAMLNISTCPRCTRLVTLPEIDDSAIMVRCPLCHAEYALSEALASTPPMLVVVPKGNGVASSAVPTSSVSASSEIVAIEEVSAEEVIELDSPADFALDFAEGMAESAPSEDGKLAGMEAFALNTGDLSAQGKTAASKNELVQASTPATPLPAPPRPRPLVKPLPPRPKRKPKGMIRTLIEWLFGAAFALCIAYYGIWWIRGESAGLPRFDWLPGLPAEEPKTVLPLPKQSTPETVAPKAPNETNEHVANPPQSIEVKKIAETPEPTIGPRRAAKFTFMQLDDAFEIASDAFFIESGGKVTTENYPLICRLAEARTFVVPGDLSTQQKENVRLFLSNLGKDPKQRDEIARLGRELLKNSGENIDADFRGGIILVGKTGKTNSSNGMFGVTLRLAENESIPILSTEPLKYNIGDEILVAGSLIAQPAKNIAGFSGTSPLAVWLGDSVTLASLATEEKK